MDEEKIYDALLEAYETDDVKTFNELNQKYNLGLMSIDQVVLLENRPTFDLSIYGGNGQYMKNYTTSRFIVNMEPLPKHILKEPEFRIYSYSYIIFHVLTRLEDNPDLDDLLENIELDLPSHVAKEILISKGFVEINPKGEAVITDYGAFRLMGVNWVGFYESYLDYFDFHEFERYMQENDTGSVVKNSLNYMDEHLKIAYQNKEFDRLHDVFSSKAMIYLSQKKFKKALIEELKLFSLKLNPIYLDKEDLESYQAIEFPNINNILELEDLSKVNSLKGVFYKAWEDMELEEMLMSKEEAFEYLMRACEGEMLDELCDEISDKYF